MVIVLLGLTTGLTYLTGGQRFGIKQGHAPQPPLLQSFTDLPGWLGMKSTPLTENIVRTLDLDDYLYRTYGASDLPVSLYIGYYRTAGKVGASHDPLVCFQGQGWQIVNRGKGLHEVPGVPDRQVSYATMMVQRGNNRELIIYWFQTHDRTSDNTFKQKIDMIRQRLTGGGENNAFVRISAPLGKDNREIVRQKMMDFLDVFYPRFKEYITTG